VESVNITVIQMYDDPVNGIRLKKSAAPSYPIAYQGRDSKKLMYFEGAYGHFDTTASTPAQTHSI
jgi:hypothetical protein